MTFGVVGIVGGQEYVSSHGQLWIAAESVRRPRPAPVVEPICHGGTR